MMKPASPRVVRPKRPPCILVCAKCARKVDDGQALLKALKAGLASKATGRHAGKLVKTKCLGVCPKRAVTIASGTTLARGELLVVRSVADVPAALESLAQ